LLFAVVILAGCAVGDADDATIERTELSRTVLQPEDLPRVFFRFDQGRQLIADTLPGRRSDPARFGRIEGWKARYRRPGSTMTRGPLVIDSRSDLFESSGGAKDDFGAAGDDLKDSEFGWKPIDEPGLGDESFAATFVEGSVRYYQAFWRDDNVTATLNVNGFEGKLALADVLELARKQQRRIAGVAG
jgi:hypothetical protein